MSDGLTISVGTSTCGRSIGVLESLACIREETRERGLNCRIIEVGCAGHCYAEPIVTVGSDEIGYAVYGYMDVVSSRGMVLDLVDGGHRRDDCLIGKMLHDGSIVSEELALRASLERRIILGNCGVIDPLDIDAYQARGGFEGLQAALSKSPDAVVQDIIDSGLRGRGGAGFPTGEKWSLCRQARGERTFVICNADEGDPGAFMDRAIFESDPFSAIEGLTIAAYAVGAQEGWVYVRREYPLVVERLNSAIALAYERGILGPRVLGEDYSFDLHVFLAAGAFVCGEETALIASMEGNRGEPRIRPPFPTSCGLYGCPTVIDNVKTLVCVCRILQKGPAWFSSVGTTDSPGTAVFALAGNVARSGLVEVPMGSTIRQVIFDAGGGMADPNFVVPGSGIPADGLFMRNWTPPKPPLRFKAVQIGGPSGGCLPQELLDVPIDFDSLQSVGAMMGSGGMVVISQDDCMVDLARYFLEFTRRESCGGCVICREGIPHMLEYLEHFTQGEGDEGDVERLRQLAQDIQQGSRCNLGRTAANPVLSALHYFPDEFRRHYERKECPALVCKSLISYRFEDVGCASACEECCVVCDAISSDTSYDGLTGRLYRTHFIDDSLCLRCGICVDSCAGINHASIVKVSPAGSEVCSRG